MKRNRQYFGLICLTGLIVAATLAGCGRKAPPPIADSTTRPSAPAPPPDEPRAPAPTISLDADPASIERGGQTTLSWRSANASSIRIDNGVGNVAESGSIVVSPLESTTYTAVASGSGGESRAVARVTVVEPASDVPVVSTDTDNLRRAIEEGKVKDVFFAYDKAELSPTAVETLKENAIWLRRYPEARVTIEGHCDERGTEEYNLALGDRRALAARDYLIQLGVDPNQMRTISLGEERPFAQGHDEAAWAQNRRAHFVAR